MVSTSFAEKLMSRIGLLDKTNVEIWGSRRDEYEDN
jgi:hypothetical protein